MKKLPHTTFDTLSHDVQTLWNHFESTLSTIIHKIVPYEPFINNKTVKSTVPNAHVKSKIVLRKRLLKSYKNAPGNILIQRIKNLNAKIKTHFINKNKKAIRISIIPNNNKTLWQAVKIAKNINISPLPKQLNHNNVPIKDDKIPDAFANYFMEKITTILNETCIDNSVYNGKRKISTHNDNFMSKNDDLKAVKALKVKNCEGHARYDPSKGFD